MSWRTMGRGKRVLCVISALACVGALLFGLWVSYDLNRSYPNDTEQVSGMALATKVERGLYVARASDCVACHTSAGSAEFAGGYKIDTPFGAIYSSNITQDRKFGIGGWSKSDFDRAVRHGKGSHGYLYPAMPYTAYTKLSDRDVDDLWAYMKTIKPVAKDVIENRLPFPFNQRWSLAGWNILFFKDARMQPVAGQSAELARGAYLVDGPGHCAACHTAKNLLGGDRSAYLQGGTIDHWYASDISPNPKQGIGQWSEAELVEYLRTGTNDRSVASAEMGVAIKHSLQYLTDPDLRAISRYLKSIPSSDVVSTQPLPATNETMQVGKRIFEAQCNSCHLTSGAGVRKMIPRLADSAVVNATDPSTLIHIVLKGGDGPVTHKNPTGAGMPAFDWRLTDSQVADVLTYVRNSWGNTSSPVGADAVTAFREAVKARPALQNPSHPRSQQEQR